jgi:aspartyl-tRNA synthetase
VTVQGWVHRRVITAASSSSICATAKVLLQIVCDPDNPANLQTAETLRNEFVVSITGKVRPRPDGTVNVNLVSGEVEVLAQSIEILNPSLTPPFSDGRRTAVGKRAPRVPLSRFAPPHDAKESMAALPHREWRWRNYLDKLGFIDIETPMLTRSTPEGARDYLVPSRVHAVRILCPAAVAAAVQAEC